MDFNLKILFSLSLSLLILMNPFGNVPLFLSLMKGIAVKRQKQIIIRELLIALIIIILFYYIGGVLLDFLNITLDILQIAGGVILFLLSLKMLFPPEQEIEKTATEFKKITEPLVVPLAIPLVAGPAVLSAVMLYSNQVSSILMFVAIILAWLITLCILLFSSNLSKWLGDRGLVAIERLMGFILVLIATQMFLSGIKNFMKS